MGGLLYFARDSVLTVLNTKLSSLWPSSEIVQKSNEILSTVYSIANTALLHVYTGMIIILLQFVHACG